MIRKKYKLIRMFIKFISQLIMLDKFNNIWVIIISIIILIIIFRKLYNINEPFDENRFIEQYINQQRLRDKLNINLLPNKLPELASYYVGLK